MNWKHVLVIALAALLAISACKKKKADEPAPGTTTTTTTTTEPATTTPPTTDPATTTTTTTTTPTTDPAATTATTTTTTTTTTPGDPCEAYIAKMIECSTAGLPPEAVEATVAAMKDGFKQGCDAMNAAGQGDFIAKAMDACKDTACGAGGADWMMCHSTKMAELAMAAAGVPATP